MHLENSEQGKGCGEEVMLAEQCQVPKLTEAVDIGSPSKGSAELGMGILVEYTEQTVVSTETDPSVLCVDQCSMDRDQTQSFTYCNGRCEGDEQYPASDGFFLPDPIVDRCETSGLSQPFEECAPHRECFKPCKSSEHGANHSLAPEFSACCEQCTEHLQLFQQCEHSDQQFDFEPETSTGSCEPDCGQSEMSDFTSESLNLCLLQQNQPSDEQGEDFDSEPGEITSFTPDISDAEDQPDCGAELYEYDETDDQNECAEEEEYEEGCEPEEEESSDQDSTDLTEDLNPSRSSSPAHVCFDDCKVVSFADGCCELQQLVSTDDRVSDNYESSQEYEPPPQCSSDQASEFCTDEDGSSECSSVETKSFKTCPEGSIPSDPCSDSSGESEKGAQEDSSDEQTQWESFEDDDDLEQSTINRNNKDKEEMAAVDIVIEDYFDLFDRSDYFGHAFAQKKHYVSCFDGGDIHDHLYLQQNHAQAQKKEWNQKALKEEVPAEDFDVLVRGDDEDEDVYVRGDDEDEDVHVEDANQGDGSSVDVESTPAVCREEDKEEEEEKDFLACSEREPYWSLVDSEGNGEMYDAGVEEYYAFQIKSIPTLVLTGLGELVEDTSGNERENDVSSLNETQTTAQEFKSTTFEITEVRELSDDLANLPDVEETAYDQSPDSDDDSGFSEISTDIKPSDIIHSVASELDKKDGGDAETRTSERSRDSEEEPSDDESSEPCECDYCIPSLQQTPARPLLPQLESNDAGKICVIIDLDETLVHSSFKPVNNADFIIPVEIDGTVHQVYVLKRPHVDEFLKRMGEMFECVLFTASLSKYADPVSDLLDKWGAFRSRLFRESCVFHKGNYVKDLSRLGRDLNKVIIIDNSPASYIFHPENAVPVASWFDDMNDTELLDLIPFFQRLSKADDVYDFLAQQRTPSS
ncbi:uncharacterized protein V6R79_000749 [Siganus canaliculatus]